MLGPLTNPAGAKRQVMGVFDGELTDPLANVLMHLGSEHVMVVHGSDGLDEITLAGPTRVSEMKNGLVTTYDLDPKDFGLNLAETEALKGGDPEANAGIASAILKGEKGSKRDVVILNAGAVIYVGGKADSIEAGMKAAAEAIDSGAALAKLEQLVALTNG